MATATKKTKRASFDIRNAHIAMGAVTIGFDIRGGDWISPGSDSVPADKRKSKLGDYLGTDSRKMQVLGQAKGMMEPAFLRQYRTMERKGIRVTSDIGCFAPVEQFATIGGGASEKGYQLSFFARNGWVPEPDVEKKMGEAEWAADKTHQLSHRCHRRWCCRIDHLVVEERWRNSVRNFCLGPLEVNIPGKGVVKTCGCSLQYHFAGKSELAGMPCLRPYEPSPKTVPVDMDIVSSHGDVKTLLLQSQFPLKYRFEVWAERDRSAQARASKAVKGKELEKTLAAEGLISPDWKLNKKARLVDGETVQYSNAAQADAKKLAFCEYDESDDFVPEKKRK